ncbi:MAG TPA: hypothetical protein VFX47_07830 [Gammaproteobacteria bacterium]|nr:hypothetical protein [Gammaproteobacteria bacterium]
MTEIPVCWKCGSSLEQVPKPLSRLSECLNCRAELHVCRLCELYDPHKAQSCVEPRADPPLDKQRANFCEYFQPRVNAWQPQDQSPASKARAELENLFGKKS